MPLNDCLKGVVIERNPYPQWITVGQGPTVLAEGAGEDCLAFSLSPSFSNGSKKIKILAQRTVKPKATTSQLYECLIVFFLYILFNF